MQVKIGSLVEVMHSSAQGEVNTSRGVVLQLTKEGLWPSYQIYFFDKCEKAWHYEYELTPISEATENE